MRPALFFVIPAKAGIHFSASRCPTMDAGFRRHDDKQRTAGFLGCDSAAA
jgi:hypothetical protein